MEHVPQLIEDYAALNPYARELIRDLARSFRDRFPALSSQEGQSPASGPVPSDQH